ncbi:MAG TPA: PRC-barrel domain-containing protein [Candidatus Limnocylindria bacterium]|nr:PRC-barrel domain-containing protein [Candidatus Limnocylindria bacterium]
MSFRALFCVLLSLASLIHSSGQNAAPPTVPAAQQSLSLRVAGSSVVDVNGEMSGNVESVVINPQTGQIQFALVSTDYPANRLNVTPIPWQMLRYRSSGGIPGTFQQLILPVARNVVTAAPRITSEQSAATDNSGWMNTSATFFQTAAGGVNAASGAPGANVVVGGGGSPFSPFATVAGAAQTQPTNGFGFTTNSAGGRGVSNLIGGNQYVATNTVGGQRVQTNFAANVAVPNSSPTNTAIVVPNGPGNIQGAVPVNPPADVGAPPNDSGAFTPGTLPGNVVPPNKQPLAPAAPAQPAAPARPAPRR